MRKFIGTGVAMITPFMADGSIDFKSLRKLTHHLIDGRVEFLVILGTTGESVTLSETEQEQVTDCVLEANAGRLPFMLGCGGNDTAKVAAKMRKWTKQYGPDAFLSVAPYYNKPGQMGLIGHFSALAECTDLPIVLYNVPGRTSSNIVPATVLELAAKYGNIIAIKEASGNLEQGMEIVRGKPDGFLVLSGDDVLTLPMIAAGFDGVVSVVGNALPREFSDMVRSALAGDFVPARTAHYSMMHLIQLLFAEGNPAGIKACLELLGIGSSFVRLPLWPCSSGLKSAIEPELKMLRNQVR